MFGWESTCTILFGYFNTMFIMPYVLLLLHLTFLSLIFRFSSIFTILFGHFQFYVYDAFLDWPSGQWLACISPERRCVWLVTHCTKLFDGHLLGVSRRLRSPVKQSWRKGIYIKAHIHLMHAVSINYLHPFSLLFVHALVDITI